MDKTLWTATLKLWAYTGIKIPLIFWLRPRIIELDPLHCAVRIPLGRRSKNHLHSMYFGALSVGADLVGGTFLLYLLKAEFNKVTFAFKDYQAEFLKRAEGDVRFVTHDGLLIADAINKARETKERQNVPIQVIATVPSISSDEPVARFTLTLSLKFR